MNKEDENKDLDYKFSKYISKIKELDKDISDEDKLYLYSRYKQANEGDNTRDKPSILNRVEMEKWKAWNELKGMDIDIAKKEYIKKVKDLWRNK
jgi:diazepam-binding inhibitor (GABA receptor modulating acyl-CoA-binding protein)